MLEQEIASAMKFVHAACGSPPPYYWQVPQGFVVPSIFFPVPEVTTHGDTLSSYRLQYTWYIKCFAKDTVLAYEMALAAVVAIKENRCVIPLIEPNGDPVGKGFRVLDPSIRKVEDGVFQITISWHSPRIYQEELHPQGEKAKKIIIKDFYRPDVNRTESMRAAFDNAMRSYGYEYPLTEDDK